MKIQILAPVNASAYRNLRLNSLREWPPAFGVPAEEEEQLNLKDFENRLVETNERCFFGAFAEDTLVGSLRFSRYSGKNEQHRAYLAGLYVAPKHRGRGYGRALVAQAIDRAKGDNTLRRLNLTVVSGQTSAIKLYHSLGFVSYGIEKEAFEARGQLFDEILMTLELGSVLFQAISSTEKR